MGVGILVKFDHCRGAALNMVIQLTPLPNNPRTMRDTLNSLVLVLEKDATQNLGMKLR